MEEEKQNFSLGLFGDMMQRIYLDGKEDLINSVPMRWEQPKKIINHRSQKRIVDLINKIRLDVDGIQQIERSEKQGGLVRLFILDSTTVDKDIIEERIKIKMAQITADNHWVDEKENSVKMLILEHHMAAIRLRFENLFLSLYQVEKYRQGLRDGTLSSLNFFIKNILPLVEGYRENDKLKIIRHISTTSPLLKKDNLKNHEGNQIDLLKETSNKVNDLMALWNNSIPTLHSILLNIHNSKLFDIPNIFLQLIENEVIVGDVSFDEEEELEEDSRVLDAWSTALQSSFNEVEKYYQYVSDKTQFATHQGVKGLEYDRVIGILNDQEARGFLFSYEKLLGVKDLSSADLASIDRTKRLLYVVCSRAKESLVLVAYTENIERLKNTVVDNGWFNNDEILFLEDLD